MIFLAIVAVIQAIALVAVCVLFLRRIDAQEARNTTERSELLNRIQHPERTPVQLTDPFVFPENEDDDVGLVGAILEPKADE